MSYLPLSRFLQQKKQLIDELLLQKTNAIEAPTMLKEAMAYSLKAGGKRIRPILLLATIEALGKNEEIGYPVACAIEMLHTYSLIHDDLPSMDNDDFRRGKPTNHKVFGEAKAILAGDALLTYSFELIASIDDSRISDEMKVHLIRRLAHAAGPGGMVGGQIEDLEAENREQITIEELESIHHKKTGKMFIFPVYAGAVLGGGDNRQIHRLEQFAFHLGVAFQIRDDILDIEGDERKIGKPIGSDVKKQKSTYPKLLTLNGAKQKLADHIEKAKENLHEANINHDRLLELATYITVRDH